MTTVAVCFHGARPDAVDTARLIGDWLHARGHRAVTSEPELALLGGPDGAVMAPDHGVEPIDLVVSIGGDGTMLRATRRAIEAGAVVLGVNLGQLGYLAEVEPGAWEEALAAYFAGTHQVVERMTVASEVHPAEGPSRPLPVALNEVVVEKQSLGRTVRLGVSIDERFFTSYVADGLILATPTGSTAYSLSARGPIVDPTHRAMLLTPVSPHSLFDRALVLDPRSVVDVTVLGDRPAAVSVDGEELEVVSPGSRVRVVTSATPARLVTFGDRDFHQILKAKFGLSDR
jgi:NAD+ kinase